MHKVLSTTGFIFLSCVFLLCAACGGGESATSPDGDIVEQDTTGDTVEPDPEAVCTPDERICRDNDIMQCNEDGTAWLLQSSCREDMVCIDARCIDESELEGDGDQEDDETDDEPDVEETPDGDTDPDPDPDPDPDDTSCITGELRCNGDTVEVCLPGGSGWLLQETCTPCQYCEGGACMDMVDCEVEVDIEEELDTDPEVEPEPEEETGCNPLSQPSYCQEQYLWRCENNEMIQYNCEAIGAVCMIGADSDAHCVGIEGAACIPEDENGCLSGLVCEEYECRPPGGCRDINTLISGDIAASTGGATDDLGHDPRSCINRDYYGADVMYTFVIGANQVLEASLSGAGISSSALYILSDCADVSSCADGVTYLDNKDYSLRFEAPASGTYYLVVDSLTGIMDYTLHTHFVESSVCSTAQTITANTTIMGDTTGQGRNFDPGTSCRYGTLTNGAPGQEVFYRLEIGNNQEVEARLEVLTAGADGVLYVLDDCVSPQCEYGVDERGVNQVEEASVGTSSSRSVILVVDERTDVGMEYRLIVSYTLYSGCGASPLTTNDISLLCMGLAAAAMLLLRSLRKRRKA